MTGDFLQLATLGVQRLQPYQPGKPIEELEREYGIKQAIKLASNENPLGADAAVITAIQNHLPNLARYPDSNGFRLKQALAKKYQVDMDMITLGNGSNDVLEFIARAFVTNDHSVMFSEHAFAVYPLITQALSAKAIVTPAKNWGYDLIAMQQAIREDTRLIFIANPNNPTGTWLDEANLKNFLKQVPEQVIVVLDEAYFEYAREYANYPNGLNWLAEYPNLIIVRTFSKAYGLAGLRVGYAIAHAKITNIINRVRQPFNVNSLALVAAEVALQCPEHLNRVVELNRQGMQQLITGIQALHLQYIESAGNFITIGLNQPGNVIYDKLLREGIIVRPIGVYNMPYHLRISVGLPAENEACLAALQKVLSQS
jgi:histidinol-phosphate aminotransferase